MSYDRFRQVAHIRVLYHLLILSQEVLRIVLASA